MKLRAPQSGAYLAAGIFLIIGCIATALFAMQVSEKNQLIINRTMATATERVVDDVIKRLAVYEYGLRSTEGVIITAGQENLSRALFHRYSLARDMDLEFPGARGFGFIRRVPLADESAFVERARLDDSLGFQLRQLAPHNGERFIIQYIEPLARNRQAVGLDIASEANRREAAIDAMRTGEIRLTGPITLVQAADSPQQSFLMLLPLYTGVITPATAEAREKLAYGWSYAPLLMSEVLTDIGLNRRYFELSLRDVTSGAAAITIFDADPNHEADGEHHHNLTRNVYGRDWNFELHTYPAFEQSLQLLSPKTVYTIGSIISVLGALVVFSLGKIFGLRRESSHQRQMLAAMVETSLDALITCDTEGKVLSWNRSAQALFGFSEDEAIGRLVNALILPDDRRHEEANIQKSLQQQQAVPHFVSQRHTKAGHLIDVSISVAPIIERGVLTGYSKTIRDITDEVANQQQILDLNQNLESLVDERTLALERSTRTLQGVLDNIPSAVAYWDTELQLIIANRVALSDFAMASMEEARGRTLLELSGKSGYALIHTYFQQVLDEGAAVTNEFNFPLENGDAISFELHVVPEKVGEKVVGLYSLRHDLTDLRQSRQQLASVVRENEALLATINEQMLYSVTDCSGTIIEVNDNFCRVTGYERDGLIGHNHRLLNSGVHPRAFWSEMWQTITAGNPWRGEICNRDKQGKLKWFDSVIAPFVGEDGNIERFVALRSDITDKRAAEDERNRVSLLLTNVLDAASEVAVMTTDIHGIVTIFNTGAEKMLGYSAKEMIGKPPPEKMHVAQEVLERSQELSKQFGESITGFETLVYLSRFHNSDIRDWTYRRKDGSKLRVSLAITAMRDSQGEITGYLGVAQDITEQERSRRELLTVRDQLTVATDVAQLGVWSLNVEDNSIVWNDRMFEIYHLSPPADGSGPTYEQWLARIHPEDVKEASELVSGLVQGQAIYNQVFRIVHPNGRVLSLQGSARVERGLDGEVISVTGINRDITDQLHLETELRRAKDLADSANAAKSNFLANMSHEIRTPMNAVLGMLQLVAKTQLDERQLDYVSKANLAANSLLGLLNDILDFSKIEAGKLSLEKSTFSLDELMRDVGVVLSGYQRKDSVELIFDIDTALPQELNGDRLRIQQLLLNLGGNALKFTEQGLVIVRLQQLQRTQSLVNLRISVEDSGIGIHPDHIEHIFEGFMQAEASTTRRFGGTGLGLVICKRLTELLGSELYVESEQGKGSRFWFDLSIEVASEVLLVKPKPSANILIVDGNQLVAEILAGMLSQLGYQCDVVCSAAAAIGKVQTAHKLKCAYDLVLMDWQLPDLSGLQAAEFITDSDAQLVAPKIIMLTAQVQKFAEAELTLARRNYSGLLTKPITPQQLHEAIEKALDDQSQVNADRVAVEQAQSSKSGRLDSLRLLVVEDNALNRQVASELLAAEGARVELAEGGLQGVEKVLAGKAQYDLVIMDVQMPDIDGLEATRRIRADRRFKTLPILAMTANASASDRNECLAAGMNEHVGKPMDMEVLVPMILALTGSGNQTTASPLKESASSNVLLRFGGNIKLFKQVQAQFYPEAMQQLASLKAALAEADRKTALAVLHSLKGTAGTMGAEAVADYSASLESDIKADSKADLEQLISPAKLAQLEQLLVSSAAELAALAAELSVAPKTEAALTPTPTPTPVLSVDDLKHRLEKLIPLLEADNLNVLDSIEQLFEILSHEQQQQLELLREQISALAFTPAIASIKTLLRNL